MKEVFFEIDQEGIKGFYPHLQFVDSFFVSRELMRIPSNQVKIRPLTLDHLIRDLLINEWIRAKWFILRILYLTGMFDPPEGIQCGFMDIPRYWRWNFVKTRRERAEKEKFRQLHAYGQWARDESRMSERFGNW